LVALAVLIGIFSLGVFVGYHKARFSYAWGENYHNNFGGPRGGLFKDFSGKEFMDAHGTYGQIVKVTDSTLVVKGSDSVEKIVVVNDDTSIMRLRDAIKISDLKINDNVIIIGEPNEQGQIGAKFIRFLPATLNLPIMNRR
jgi:hypothetical protein